MLLVLDIGNTNIKAGIFDDKKLIVSWRFSTDTKKSADEYGMIVTSFLTHMRIKTSMINDVIICSVVPTINSIMESMCMFYLDKQPMFVDFKMNTGIEIAYKNPEGLGADRIVNAAGAYKLYGGPNIVIDFGTATAINVVTTEGKFIGGAICPGVMIAQEALVSSTSKLFNVELKKPDKVIGSDTTSCMQSGIIHGYVGMIDYLVNKMKDELSEEGVKIIATGGLANLIGEESDTIDIIDGLLTLKGLQYLYSLNKF